MFIHPKAVPTGAEGWGLTLGKKPIVLLVKNERIGHKTITALENVENPGDKNATDRAPQILHENATQIPGPKRP